MRAIDVFVDGLNKSFKQDFIYRIEIKPLSKPAYKSVLIEIYVLIGTQKQLYASSESTHMILDDEQKEKVINTVTADIISVVIGKCMLYEII